MGGDGSGVDAGLVGLLLLLLLFVAAGLLARSMVRHVRRVPATFDPPPGRGQRAGGTSGGDTPGGGTPGGDTPTAGR